MEERDCVASMQYSKKSKIFLFPRKALRPEWLDVINYVVVSNKHIRSFDILCFLVSKLNQNIYEIGVEPEPVLMTEEATPISFKKADIISTNFGEESRIEKLIGKESKKNNYVDELFNHDESKSRKKSFGKMSLLEGLIYDPQNTVQHSTAHQNQAPTEYFAPKHRVRKLKQRIEKPVFENFDKEESGFDFYDFDAGFEKENQRFSGYHEKNPAGNEEYGKDRKNDSYSVDLNPFNQEAYQEQGSNFLERNGDKYSMISGFSLSSKGRTSRMSEFSRKVMDNDQIRDSSLKVIFFFMIEFCWKKF